MVARRRLLHCGPLTVATVWLVGFSSAWAEDGGSDYLVDAPLSTPTESLYLIQGQVGALYMHRTSDPGSVLSQNGENSSFFQSDQLNFGYQPGVDVDLTARFSRSWSLDVRGMWLDGFSAQASRPFDTALSIQTTPVSSFASFSTGGNAQFGDHSQFSSGEINLRLSNIDRVGISGGLRYARLAEEFSALYGGSIARLDQQTSTVNHLLGFQVGADLVIWSGLKDRLRFDGFAKGGVYVNEAKAQYNDVFTSTAGYYVPHSAANNNGAPAFLGEVGIRPRVGLTKHLWLTGGYQVLGAQGVALATQQIRATGSIATLHPAVSMSVDTGGLLLMHGGYVGLEAGW